MSGNESRSPPAPRVELICTGAELLAGVTVNTHTRLLGERLASLGLTLAREACVRDDLRDIADAVREAMTRARIVFVSGGLGPTSDDLTREALADLLHRDIVFDPAALQAVRDRCARMNRPSSPSRERQALVLAGAEALPNSAGMAPGQWLDVGDRTLIILPGPPREFRAVLEEEVEPRLQSRFPLQMPRESLFRICGLAESDLVEALEKSGFDPGRSDFACCARPGCLDIRIRAHADATADADRTAELIRRIAGPKIVEESLRPLETVLVEKLRAAGRTLAVAESCTGGLIGGRLSSVPGCSDVFLGGVIAYSNAVKTKFLGVSPKTLESDGAVSEQTAREMAQGARDRFGSDLALSVTGIAGPGGGAPDKPVGLVWMAVASDEGIRTHHIRFPGGREFVREGASTLALDLVRQVLLAPR